MAKRDPRAAIIPERDKDKTPAIECIGLGIDIGGLTALDDFNPRWAGRNSGLIGPNAPAKAVFTS
jgi:branched-chain amino acid transport system ATP-binding protein